LKIPQDTKDLKTSMKAHNHMKWPNSEFNLLIRGDDLLTILDCLLNVHTALIREISAGKGTEASNKKAYDFAYDTEIAYDSIMSKLGLYRNERSDLN